MNRKNNQSSEKRAWRFLFAILVLLLALTLGIWRYYVGTIEKSGLYEKNDGREFARHYVMISDNYSSSLWKDIYKSAVETGKKKDAYVEIFGDWFTDEYDAVDYMDIAIAAQVDGIIVKPDGTARMQSAINRAEDAGIPVVTVVQDDSLTNRTSFVGINSYQFGMTYGNLICNCISEDTRSVLVLLNEKEAGKELVFKQLKETVQESGLAENVRIDSMTIVSQNVFDAEEVIHDLFLEEATRPDILVCMDEADSERAYQALIEYNCVGEVEIIGYYQTDTMLQAIQKGIVPAAVLLNANEIGTYCIEALEEYAEMGYVSNYFSVALDIVTKENIAEYLQEEQ